jgi:hypothetical protein
MNTLYLAVLLTAVFRGPLPPAGAPKNTASGGKKDTVITQYRLRYDHTVLRIPVSRFPSVS